MITRCPYCLGVGNWWTIMKPFAEEDNLDCLFPRKSHYAYKNDGYYVEIQRHDLEYDSDIDISCWNKSNHIILLKLDLECIAMWVENARAKIGDSWIYPIDKERLWTGCPFCDGVEVDFLSVMDVISAKLMGKNLKFHTAVSLRSGGNDIDIEVHELKHARAGKLVKKVGRLYISYENFRILMNLLGMEWVYK